MCVHVVFVSVCVCVSFVLYVFVLHGFVRVRVLCFFARVCVECVECVLYVSVCVC